MNEAERRAKSITMFDARLEDNGGVYSLFDVTNLTGMDYGDILQLVEEKSVISVVRAGKGLLFPKTQFHSQLPSTYIQNCYRLLPNVSDVMLYSFFYSGRFVHGYSQGGCKDKIIDVLKDSPSGAVMQEVYRLARLFGTMDAA